MNRIWTLVRAGLKVNFGLSLVRYRLFKEKKDIWLVPLIGVAFLGILPTLYGFILFVKHLFVFLHPLGQERAILTIALLAGQFFILLFGLYYVISAFYFSRDLEMLIPMPLKPFQVLFSKFAIILVNEYLTVFLIVLPPLITYGVLSRGGVPYWVNTFLVYLFLPVIPLAVVTLLVVVLMRMVNFSRKKDALILVGSLILVAFGISVQFLLNRSVGSHPDIGATAAAFVSPDSLILRLGSGFPPSVWATKAIAGGFSASGLSNLALFLGASLALFGALLVLAEKLFYRGLIGIGEITGRNKALSRAQMSRRISSGRRPIQAVFIREWRIMNRTPIFLLNGVLVVLIIPVVFIVMAKAGRGGGMAFFLNAVLSTKPVQAILISALFMTICGSLNGTSSSTFSREGRQFWMSRIIPVSPRDQVTAKFLHSCVISMMGIASASIVVGLILHLKVILLAAAIMLAFVMALLFNSIGMMVDLARPLLDWTNPQKAIKQNFNVLIAMLVDIGLLTALGFGAKVLLKAGMEWKMLLILLFVLLAAFSVAAFILLVRFASRKYTEIET